jgi:DNA-binding response OmpR family regulator
LARQPVYVFEGFRLDAQRRVLYAADGRPIELTPRLFDTLLYFVEHAGQQRYGRTSWSRSTS